jgi:hypothetical protein
MGVPGGGGGGVFFTTRAQSEKVGQIYFRPPNFFLTVRPCQTTKCIKAKPNVQLVLCKIDFWNELMKLDNFHHDDVIFIFTPKP